MERTEREYDRHGHAVGCVFFNAKRNKCSALTEFYTAARTCGGCVFFKTFEEHKAGCEAAYAHAVKRGLNVPPPKKFVCTDHMIRELRGMGTPVRVIADMLDEDPRRIYAILEKD